MAPRARPRAHEGTCSDRTLAALTPGRLGQIVGVLVVMLLDQETGIAAVIETVRALHERGTLTVYGMAALARQGGVGPVLRQPVSRQEALAAPSVGAAVGTLVSVLEGPLNIAMRASGHGLIIAVRDLGDVGLDAGFLEQVSRDLKVGGGAIVAEIDESQPLALENFVVAQKAELFRYRLAGSVTERRLMLEIRLLSRELTRLEKRYPGRANSDAALAMQRAHEGTCDCGETGPSAGCHAASRGRCQGERAASSGEHTQRSGVRGTLSRRAALIRNSLEDRADRLERAANAGTERLAGNE